MLHNISVRTMCLGLVVGMIVLAGRDGICASTNSVDGMYKYVTFGMGNTSCGSFVYSMRSKDIHNINYIAWVAGYLTAVNFIRPDTYNILGNTDLDSALLWLENYCNNNPSKSFAYATFKLIIYLVPNRLTKEPEDTMKR